MRRNEVAREDVGVGQEQDVGNAVQVRDLAHVLERGAAFPLDHDPRLRGERVENGLQRFRQAGRDEQHEGVGGRQKSNHALKKAPERGRATEGNFRPTFYVLVPSRLLSQNHLMSDLAIDIRKVVKRFGDFVAVRELSLEVPRGSVYGLLGPNGAGKTTTIRMILDVLLPDSGTISLFGRPNTDYGVLDRVGYLPEERGLYKKMQVRRVLLFLAELKGMRAKEVAPRIDEWLERFGLVTPQKNWGDAKIDELSRGMQQKVQFIATLLHDPDLVILDEPFSGLDPINAQALKDAVLELKRRGKTVIFSTHVMDNAEKMCDSVCIIARGEKVLDGSVTEVKRAAGTRNVAIGLSGGAARRTASPTSCATRGSCRSSTTPTITSRSSWRPTPTRKHCCGGS